MGLAKYVRGWLVKDALADFMSKNEEDLLDTFLIDGTSYWLGLTDLSREGSIRILDWQMFKSD